MCFAKSVPHFKSVFYLIRVFVLELLCYCLKEEHTTRRIVQISLNSAFVFVRQTKEGIEMCCDFILQTGGVWAIEGERKVR